MSVTTYRFFYLQQQQQQKRKKQKTSFTDATESRL